jgi:GT2 family glycosyltransferase
MEKPRHVSAVVPTIGRVETLPMTLTSIAFQVPMVDELILLDEADGPVTENFAVSQALDLLSIYGVKVKVIRSRRRKGIGPARYLLVGEAKFDLVLMVDDDVVLRPGCLEHLLHAINTSSFGQYQWAVPSCLLIPKNLSLDGYCDEAVFSTDPRVVRWTEEYPWFIPYFRYIDTVIKEIGCSGTQAILLRKRGFLKECELICKLKRLPREDTLMTVLMGTGMFTSLAECVHFEHISQVDRGSWELSMFYRLHESVLKNPKGFVELMGY